MYSKVLVPEYQTGWKVYFVVILMPRSLFGNEMAMNSSIREAHIPESAFGKWFLRSDTWTIHVLATALNDLEGLLPKGRSTYSKRVATS